MGLCDTIYNKETGQILTRTPESWGKIGLFYLVYYSCLAAFFAGLLSIFLFAFTDDKAPLLTGSHSVLPQNPGMGFRPRPDEEKTLIKYSVSDNTTYAPYIADMTKFLNPEGKDLTYLKGQSDAKVQDCQKGAPSINATYSTKPCSFKVADMKSIMDGCVNANYGYEEGSPCFAIKVNKIYEFIPEVNDGTGALKLQCEGEYAADKDNVGTIQYFDALGDSYDHGTVDLAYWPFVGQKHYLSPLVFVRLQNPAKGVLIQIACKPINVENIKQNKMSNGAGRVTLEVLIDA